MHVTDGDDRVSPEARFGDQVRLARDGRGWSQERLAAELSKHTFVKLGQSGVARLEKGSRPTRLNEVMRIARFLDIDLRVLYSADIAEQTSQRLSAATIERLLQVQESATRDLEKISADMEEANAAVKAQRQALDQAEYRLQELQQRHQEASSAVYIIRERLKEFDMLENQERARQNGDR